MRVAVLCGLLLATSGASAGCRLSTDDCVTIAREIAAEAINQENDRETFGFSLTPFQRGLALIDRHQERVVDRHKRLPPRIAREWARMRLCDSQENLAASSGTAYFPSKDCR